MGKFHPMIFTFNIVLYCAMLTFVPWLVFSLVMAASNVAAPRGFPVILPSN